MTESDVNPFDPPRDECKSVDSSEAFELLYANKCPICLSAIKDWKVHWFGGRCHGCQTRLVLQLPFFKRFVFIAIVIVPTLFAFPIPFLIYDDRSKINAFHVFAPIVLSGVISILFSMRYVFKHGKLYPARWGWGWKTDELGAFIEERRQYLGSFD